MCGGDGGADKARDAQRDAEIARQNAIADSTNAIRARFEAPSRTAEYAKAAEAVTGRQMLELDRANADNQREIKFRAARTGTGGGSADIDLQRDAAEAYREGVIEAERRGQQVASDYQIADQNSMNQLIAMAQQGMDMTTASTNSAHAMQANAATAAAANNFNDIGQVFGSFGQLFDQARTINDENRAKKYSYNLLYGNS